MRIVLHRLWSIELSLKGIPDALFQVVEHTSSRDGRKDELKEFSTGEDEIIVSWYAKDLVIADNDYTNFTDPKTWKCWRWPNL